MSVLKSPEEIFASFAYKPENNNNNINGESTTPIPVPPPKSKAEKKKKDITKKKPSSSYLRTTVNGKTVIFSKYFPPPAGASTPPVPVRLPIRRPKLKGKGVRIKKKPKIEIGEEEKKAKEEEKKRKKAEKARFAHLSPQEKKSEAYLRVDEERLWDPPSSCYKLLQERHSFDPWRVLVICMLLNITTGKQVKSVLPSLFLLCRDAETATKVPVEEIEEIIRPLGLQKKRARMIQRFSREYLSDDWKYVTELHGIGKYAADAYAIFCAGNADIVSPQDHKLLDYWNLVRSPIAADYLSD